MLALADGTVIDESLGVMEWAFAQADPCDWRRRNCVEDQRQIQELIGLNDGAFKHHLDRFKYTDRYPGESKQEHCQAGLAILRGWSDRIQARGGWLLDARCSLADAALWPFVRQWRIADPDAFDGDASLDPLRQWLERILADPLFERLMQRADPWDPGAVSYTHLTLPTSHLV